MSVPAIPYKIEVITRLGDHQTRRVHNFRDLQTANAYAARAIRKQGVLTVATMVVLEVLGRHDVDVLAHDQQWHDNAPVQLNGRAHR